jgi:hypothetical protein
MNSGCGEKVRAVLFCSDISFGGGTGARAQALSYYNNKKMVKERAGALQLQRSTSQAENGRNEECKRRAYTHLPVTF